MKSQESDKKDHPARKTASRGALSKLKQKLSRRPELPEEPTPSIPKRALTQQEFMARVSQKAFELYETRRAITDVEDWIEAERLVKLHLLSEETGGGTV